MQTATINFNAPALKKLLKSIFSTVSSSDVLPILEFVYVSANNGKLKFEVTTLEIVHTLTIDTDFKGEVSFCIEAKKLRRFIERAIEPDCQFVVSGVSNISLKTGGFKLNANIEKSDSFPKKPIIEAGKKAIIDAKEFIPLFQTAIKYVSNDDLRPAMTGVYLHDNNGELTIVSTDAHRMYYKGICKTPEALKGVKAIIPAKGVRLLITAFKTGDTTILLDDNYIVFTNNEYELICRIIDARYPDYKAVLVNHPLVFHMNRKQLQQFMRLAVCFTDGVTNQIEFNIEYSGITVTGKSIELDHEFYYSLPIYDIRGKDEKIVTDQFKFQFAVNSKFLEDALTINPKDEYIRIEHNMESTKAIVIDECFILMPLMLNK